MSTNSIGRYEIKEALGQGGMATVYRAYDPRFGRDVAIKILPPEFMDDAVMRGRFEREARTVAGLEHPAIVPVYDVGEENGQPYLVMRLMTNGSLADKLRHGALPLRESGRILARILSALEAAHQAGIIHRDLKPGNILFDQYNEAYLSDFGIARSANATTSTLTNLTGTGGTVGTPGYMSPEQIEGKPLDARTDLYAVGILAFELLTGRRPFEADTASFVLVKQMTEPPPYLRDINPALPRECERVIQRTVTRTPAERASSAAEVAELWQAAMTAVEALDHPVTMPHRSAPTPAYAAPATAVETGQRTAIGAAMPVAPVGRPWRTWAVVGGIATAVLLAAGWFGFQWSGFISPTPTPLAAVFVATGGASTPVSTGAGTADRAQTLLDTGDTAATIDEATRCLATTPRNADCYHLRGYAYYLEGTADLAQSDLQQAVAINPQDLFSYETLGYVSLFLEGDPTAALTYFEQALAIDPTRAQSHSNICSAYNSLGQAETALAACEECRNLDPTEPLCYDMAAYAYQQLGDDAQAEANWRTAVELNPTNTYPLSELGWLVLWQGRYDEALELVQQALDVAPDNLSLVYQRGMIYAERGDVGLASADFGRYTAASSPTEYANEYQNATFYLNSVGNLNNVALAAVPTASGETAEGPVWAATDGNYNQGWAAGDTAAGPSTADPTQPLRGWLELDFAQPQTFTAIYLRTWQGDNGRTQHWLYGRASADEPYTLLATVDQETGWGTWLTAEGNWPGVRYLRVETVADAGWTGWLEVAAVAGE